MSKKKIACFFTAGYTELNAMKSFMRKIYDGAEYIRLCPTGARKSKNQIKNRHIDSVDQSGLTGDKLIEYVLEFIGKKCFQEEKYDAILIEDDKDWRFLSIQQDGFSVINEEKWDTFKKEVIEKIHKVCTGIPVIFFFAAPEVEAWFLADWKNSFGKIFKNQLSAQQNDYFNVKFRKYVNEQILTAQYREHIEAYGYFNGTYRKLSEQLQNSLQEIDFLDDFMPGVEHPMVKYSKRQQGEDMLYEINPQNVFLNCPYFFKDGILPLTKLAFK